MLGVGSAHHTFVRPGTEEFDQEMHELHMKRMPDMRREKLNLQADAEVLVKRIAENGCAPTLQQSARPFVVVPAKRFLGEAHWILAHYCET